MLRRATFLSSMYMTVGNGAQLAVTLCSFLYLARILAPADFGAMALAAAFVDLLTVFGRMGQVEVLMQIDRANYLARSTSFWLLVGVGLACAVGLAFIAAPIALLSGYVAVSYVILMLAVVPLLQNLGQVNEALLRQDLQYKGIAVRNFVATTAGACASIFFAWRGYGVYALGIQKLVFTFVYTISIWLSRPYLPGFEFDKSEFQRLTSQGLSISISNTLQMANSRIVDLNIAIFLGVSQLGITRVAWRLYEFSLQLVVAPITSVSISTLAHVRDDRTRLIAAYLRYIQLIFLVTAPLFVGLSLVATEAVLLLAGPKWVASTQIFKVLSFCALAACLSLIFNPMMMAIGKPQIIRRQAILQAISTFILTAIGAQFSAFVTVILFAVRMYLFAFLNLRLMNKALGLGIKPLLRRTGPILFSVIGMSIVCLVTRDAMIDYPVWAKLFGTASLGAVSYCLLLVVGDLMGLWRGEIKQLASIAKDVLNRKSKT